MELYLGGRMDKRVALVVLSLTLSTASATERVVRPGLWEVTTTSGLLALVPLIPPDKMQNLASLIKQYGFEMPKINNGAAISRVCITPEAASQKIPTLMSQSQFGCSTKGAVQTEGGYRLDLTCDSATVKGGGSMDITLVSPESMTGRTELSGTVHGNPITEHIDTSAKWLDADCGTVKSSS